MSAVSLQESIRRQREALTALLGEPMHDLAARCAAVIGERRALETLLISARTQLPYCKHLYVLDADGRQITDNITRDGHDAAHFGRDRSSRPYMQGIVGSTDFKLSDAYISRNKKRPSLTAIQVIRGTGGNRIGFLGADFDLRELPLTGAVYQEPDQWRQIKGDPAIRANVFMQQRVQSRMDAHLDEVLPLMNELMVEHGVFHGKFHFSSSRATVWLVDDPYSYRILGIDELLDPDICLAFPRRSYTGRAIVPPAQIMPVFDLFRRLRFADEHVYLRSGSLNVCNGMVALTFSCDGSHYMRFDEFLEKQTDFWLGV
ncbi:MAG: PDC sensor domain-containing protein [Gammaproteobacteria bacterium]